MPLQHFLKLFTPRLCAGFTPYALTYLSRCPLRFATALTSPSPASNAGEHSPFPWPATDLTSAHASHYLTDAFCVIAVGWAGWPEQHRHLLRARLMLDGRSIPLMSKMVPYSLAQNSEVLRAFLDRLIEADTRRKSHDYYRSVLGRVVSARQPTGLVFYWSVAGMHMLSSDWGEKWMKISALNATASLKKTLTPYVPEIAGDLSGIFLPAKTASGSASRSP